jgi:hypothetical protein
MAFERRGGQRGRRAMMKCAALLLGLCLAAASARAAEPPDASLFFTPGEVQKIEAAAATIKRADADDGDVHLGAVFYYGAGDWVLWLQGRRWTPSTRQADLRVTGVRQDAVRLAVAAAPGMPFREVELKPHQTYRLSTGKVVEGSGDDPAAGESR